MTRRINLTDKIFGRLTVISESGRAGKGHITWLCRCVCGNETIVRGDVLRRGDSLSCGCLQLDRSTTHGMSHTSINSVYKNMISRCYNKNNKNYYNYGGRGIQVCNRWRKQNGFQNFLEDMGERPEGMSIDRIDTNGQYSPDNCKWSDSLEQGRNQLKSKWWFIDDVRYSSSVEASRSLGVSVSVSTIKRWCNGITKQNGRYYPPRPNCWTEPKYP